MIGEYLIDGPVISGDLIKFEVTSLGSILVANKGNSADDFSLQLMTHRRNFSSSSNIAGANDEDFVDMMPSLVINQDRNSQAITPGFYALRALQDGNLRITLFDEGEELPPDTRKHDALSKVLTQYRESPRLLGMIEAYLKGVCEVEDELKTMAAKFDIDVAVGEQLTIVGRWLGFPRCHNVPTAIPVFGFECDGVSSDYNLAGFCEGALWIGCPGVSSFEVCINDDDLYRNFLYVRRYQLLGYNDYRTFVFCIRILFGTAATFTQSGRIINVNPGRTLTELETSFLRVYERVLPRAASASVNIVI